MRNDLLFFVHVLFAFTLAGGIVAAAAAGIAAGRTDDPSRVALLTRVVHRAENIVIWPSMAVLVGAGLGLAGIEDVWDEGWLGAGIVVTIVGLVFGGGLLRGENRKLHRLASRLAADGVRSSDEVRAMANRPIVRLLGLLELVLLVIVIWLMTAKPGV